MSVKIKGKLPKGEQDGLQRLTTRLRGDPEAQVVAIVLLTPSAITENLDDEDDPVTVTLKVLQVEALPPSSTAEAEARDVMSASFEQRTGKRRLMDIDSGEVV